MPKDFDVSVYSELLEDAERAFLADSSYAIAVARPAGALAARRLEKSQADELADSGV